MTAKELIKHLRNYDASTEVMILDGPNGSGEPREINLLSDELHSITKRESRETADCEGKVGQKVILLGYGSY